MENFISCKNKMNELDLCNCFSNKSFNEGVLIITNKNVISTATEFIDSLKSLIDYKGEIISSKIFLSSFFISFFHNEVLSEEKNEIETFLYEQSKYIIQLFKTLNINNKIKILEYISELNKYKNNFNQWKKKDLDSQIEIYSDIYIRFPEKRKQIKKLLELLVGKNNVESIIHSFENKNNILEDTIQKYLKEIFWDNFQKDIIDKKYEQIIFIFKDIHYYFTSINKNQISYYNEYLDIEFISINIKNENFQCLFEIIKFCLVELKKLDAPFYDSHNEQLQNINFNIDNITPVLSFLMERLEYIYTFF